MRLLVAGLSRTGTTSVHEAAQILGFTSLHYDNSRLLPSMDRERANFRLYDDFDVVGDIPSALFFRELSDAYPDSNVLLTTRNEDDWWASVSRYIGRKSEAETLFSLRARARQLVSPSARRARSRVSTRDYWRVAAYGSTEPQEELWRSAFRQHYQEVRRAIPPTRLIEVDVTTDNAWEALGKALAVQTPDTPFPHANAG